MAAELNGDNVEDVPEPVNDPEVGMQSRVGHLDLNYKINDNPPWYLCIFLGLQHYLTMFGSTVAVPFILAQSLCMDKNDLIKSQVISTIFFVSGISTLLQTSLGNRLPIVQGATFSFLAPTFAILSLSNFQCSISNTGSNVSSSDEENFKRNMREVQGAIMISSLFQIFIGFTGLVGFLLKYIGPLTIAPTISLIGLSLFGAAADFAGKQWGIAIMTIFLITLFSQYLGKVKIAGITIFGLFPVLLGMIGSWIVCAIVTEAGGFTDDPKDPSFLARTDARVEVLKQAPWFRFPYPGQWGIPTVSAAGVFGMLAGVLASMIESIGDYYACARLSGAPPPPRHAINRGIGMEGIGCLLAGAIGSGNGTTSYSENIGAIGITKVGSRRVVQIGALFMLILGVLGKFGALFVTIPDPIIGGVFTIMFGMIAAVGISNLQFVSLNSSRNLFVLGFSLFFGLVLPHWISLHPDVISTGSNGVDQIILVILKTNMAVAGVVAFILDNTIPGTDEERGIKKWRQQLVDKKNEDDVVSVHVYDLPFGFLNNLRISRFIPFLPYYPDEISDNVMFSFKDDKPTQNDHEASLNETSKL